MIPYDIGIDRVLELPSKYGSWTNFPYISINSDCVLCFIVYTFLFDQIVVVPSQNK